MRKTKKTRSLKSRRTQNHSKRKVFLITSLIIIIVILFFGYLYLKEQKELRKEIEIKEKTEDIKTHYNEFVITNKEATLYTYTNESYQKSGLIAKEQELSLDELTITSETEYFKITTFDSDYYIYYKDVDSIENLSEVNERYKKYIPYNKTIITKSNFSLYDENNNLVYTLSHELKTPIIINKDDLYGILYNNKILYIKNKDIEKIIDSKNTDKKNTSSIAVLNYHFFYDETDNKEVSECNQSICHSKKQFRTHLDYIKDNDVFTPTMKELEMYIDGQLQLPRSVVITIDDGWRANGGVDLLNEYKLNGTVFLIAKSYEGVWFKSEYVEVHSHSYNLHRNYVCSKGNQGGALICEDNESILKDLKLSREKLYNSTVFCYPFYDYDDNAISLLKEAGFTMAFAGGEYRRVTVGSNKYKIPRYVIGTWTSLGNVKAYIG